MLPYSLVYFERFPRILLSGQPIQRQAWHTPFLKDIAENGIHTPLVVWGHEDSRFSVKNGNSRLWAAEQLDIEQVPVVVSVGQIDPTAGGILVSSLEELQALFPEGQAYATGDGWGVWDARY